ncbi:GNAT family N-acetyltransferase [Allorhizocola rhizosphaerae]|uniref:GNAT family N-acetyltransferase n=1 Tax=Allorhizocola rhizosphaerae TaxID=1872709 RepID=UPI000E3CFFA0|nr:GNAT family N-acetyltransferase [Allorhizocola rhizosphaerae]
MTTVSVRPMRPGELPVVAGLRWQFTQEFDGPIGYKKEEFLHHFVEWAQRNHGTHHCMVLLRGDLIIGVAWLAITPRVPSPSSVNRRSGDLQSVYVVPAERNAGLGSLLIEAILNLARELGLERVTVHSSERAVCAYARQGFSDSPQLRHIKLV